MNTIIETLERYYNSFKDAKRSKDFFIGLEYYVEYIEETPELNKIIKIILKEEEDLINEIKKYENVALQELNHSKIALLKIIKDNKISFKELDQELKELELYENGKISSTERKSIEMERYLFDIAATLSERGYKEPLNQFIDDTKEIKNINGNFVFSKTLKTVIELVELFSKLKKSELWGYWYFLKFPPHYQESLSLLLEQDTIEDWIILDYKHYASIIHNYLMKELSLSQDSQKIIENWFSCKNGSVAITFYGNVYKPRTKPQVEFIMQLAMKHQKQNDAGKTLQKGERVSEEFLVNKIGITVKRLKAIIKQLRRSFDDKGFPLKIDSNSDGILLVHTI